jgi:ATP-dependent RNA helicase RhlE
MDRSAVPPFDLRGKREWLRRPQAGPPRESIRSNVSSFFHRSRRRGAKRPSSSSSEGQRPRPFSAAPASLEPAVVRAPEPRPQAADPTAFAELGLTEALLRAIGEQGYSEPTPVQRAVVAHVLAGRDVLACAQTGTGKTAAFLLPMLQHLAAEPANGRIRALILTPTRELAAQIVEHAELYGRHVRLRHAVIYGGVSQLRQEHALRAKPDLLVATPGRLLDLMQQRLIDLGGVTRFVLDEADRMLDMGFVHDVRRIAACLPQKRQTLLFSATMPQAIETLARQMLVTPERVAIAPKVTTAETVEQSVVFVARADKRATLVRMLEDATVERALVFTRTKHGASRLADQLQRAGIGSAAIHGNKSQGQRDRALASFKHGTTRVLVATDVAARGIDVDGVSHVINFEIPDVPETYVHRIGRTGRAGATGCAISFCDGDERRLLADIERLIRRRLPTADLAPATPRAEVS